VPPRARVRRRQLRCAAAVPQRPFFCTLQTAQRPPGIGARAAPCAASRVGGARGVQALARCAGVPIGVYTACPSRPGFHVWEQFGRCKNLLRKPLHHGRTCRVLPQRTLLLHTHGGQKYEGLHALDETSDLAGRMAAALRLRGRWRTHPGPSPRLAAAAAAAALAP